VNSSDSSDRRKAQRFDTTLHVEVRFQSDGTPIAGSCIEVGPNGMRITTGRPLVEAAYVHISFQEASNSTHCEGRVVWTQPADADGQYESGIDIQRWGGGIPGAEVVTKLPELKPKKDRRSKPR
jgi:hypothetical protein